jgi:hypothetical protein
MEEKRFEVRVRSEAVGRPTYISLLTRAEMSIQLDRIVLYYDDDGPKVMSIPRGQIERLERHPNRISRTEQLMVPAKLGLVVGAVLIVPIAIWGLIWGPVPLSIVEAILVVGLSVLGISAMFAVYGLLFEVTWSPHAVVALTFGDGKSLEVFVKEDRVHELIARSSSHVAGPRAYSKVIVVGEVRDTPLFTQAEDKLVQSIASAPRHPLAPEVEIVTERVSALPRADRAAAEPFVWALQARHGMRGGAWQVDFYDPMGFSFMVVYLE